MAEEMTVSQRAVVASCGRSALVSAGAGSGKTWVLVKRLMDSINSDDIEKRTDLNRYLIITYTKAAASELKAKISEAISKALAEETLKDPGSARVTNLRRQNAMVGSAHIGTIHSFCSDVLKEYGGAVGLRPGFKIIEEEKAEAYKTAALNKILEERYAKAAKYPGFIELADTVGAGRDDGKLVNVIRDIYESIQSHARPELWLEQAKQLADEEWTDLSQSPWGKIIIEQSRQRVTYLLDCANDLLQDATGDPSEAKNADVFNDVITILKGLQSALDSENRRSWEATNEFFPVELPGIARKTKNNDPVLHERLKKGRSDIDAELKKIAALFGKNSSEIQADTRKSSSIIKALLDTVRDFQMEYIKEKRENSLADFSDLEHCTAQLVCDSDGNPTALAKELSLRFKEIMVDEYQDVSQVQDTIFKAVSRNGRNLFFVGDIKQSIYRFRLADPTIFKEKLHNWNYYLGYSGNGNVVIPLRENFRSRSTIINAANAVFTACMTEYLGDVDYSDPTQQLVCGANYEGDAPKPELVVIQQPGEDKEADFFGAVDKLRAEAIAVADMIRSLIESGQTIGKKGETARAEYKDVAILLRTQKNVESVFRAELERIGVPVNSGAESDFYSCPEVARLVSLLSVIDNPDKDVELISVLRSPSFGFTADDLANIRAAEKKRSLYSALCKAAKTDRTCDEFIHELEELRRASSELTVSELVWHIISKTDLLMLSSAMEDGEVRRNRILKFVELAQKFEDSGYRGLHRFVSWIAKARQKGSKIETAASSTEGVTIMSVHKSKGLQFPIVFLCGTGKQFNEKDCDADVLIHPELGVGIKATNLENMTESNTFNRAAIQRKKRQEGRSEEMRLLYVALTRAQDQMYITGTVKNLEKFRAKIDDMAHNGHLNPERLSDCNNNLDWLAAAAKLDGGKSIEYREYSWEGWEGFLKKKTVSGAYDPDQEELYDLERQIEVNLTYRYPNCEAVDLPSKVTATGLKGQQEDADAERMDNISEEDFVPYTAENFRLPDFSLKDKPLSGTARGTATHLLMQHIDFSKTGSEEEITAEVQRLMKEGFIGGKEAEAVDVKAVYKLFTSETGRLIKSGSARREFKFSILCSAQELLGKGGQEQLLLQGVVDCFVDTPEGLVIVDYKTDRVFTAGDINERAQHYAPQLKAYAAALERICEKPVKECVLYFLSTGEAVKLFEK